MSACRKIIKYISVIANYLFVSIAFSAPASPKSCDLQTQKLYDYYPNSLMYYYGITVSDALVRILGGSIHRWPEHVQSIDFEHTLDENNAFRHFFSPLVGVVQVAANFTVRNGSNQNTIYEINPYVAWRWANLPWNRQLPTTLAIGEGVSYDTSIPSLEKKNHAKRLLNYLMLEATFALPSYPNLQLVARIHHRSGAYGLYRAGNTGSNAIGLGIRYNF
jgi:hypothetical protein